MVIFLNYLDYSIYQHRVILSLRNNKDITKWMTNPTPIDWHSHVDFVERLQNDHERKYFAIFLDGNLAGTYNFIKKNGKIWERGIITTPQYQGKGTTEILEKMILDSLLTEKYQIITSKVKNDNIRSICYHG